MGRKALYCNTTGAVRYNTAIGYDALFNNHFQGSGNNQAIGRFGSTQQYNRAGMGILL